MIESTYGSLLRSGLSDRTVEQVHAVLHRALDQAMHWGLTKRNPWELVTPPRPRTREMTALSKEQLQRLLEFAVDSRWHAMWTLLGTSGLRLGEALGLHRVYLNRQDSDNWRVLERHALALALAQSPRAKRACLERHCVGKAERHQRIPDGTVPGEHLRPEHVL